MKSTWSYVPIVLVDVFHDISRSFSLGVLSRRRKLLLEQKMHERIGVAPGNLNSAISSCPSESDAFFK